MSNFENPLIKEYLSGVLKAVPLSNFRPLFTPMNTFSPIL